MHLVMLLLIQKHCCNVLKLPEYVLIVISCHKFLHDKQGAAGITFSENLGNVVTTPFGRSVTKMPLVEVACVFPAKYSLFIHLIFAFWHLSS